MARKNNVTRDSPAQPRAKRASAPTLSDAKKSRRPNREESSEDSRRTFSHSQSVDFESGRHSSDYGFNRGDGYWSEMIDQLTHHIKSTLQETIQPIIKESSKKAIAESVDSFKTLLAEVDRSLNSRISTLESSISGQFTHLCSILERQMQSALRQNVDLKEANNEGLSVVSRSSRMSGKIEKAKAKPLGKIYAKSNRVITTPRSEIIKVEPNIRIESENDGSNQAVWDSSDKAFANSNYSPKCKILRFDFYNQINEKQDGQPTQIENDKISLSQMSGRAENDFSLARIEDQEMENLQPRSPLTSQLNKLGADNNNPTTLVNDDKVHLPLQIEMWSSDPKPPSSHSTLNKGNSFTGSIGREFQEDLRQTCPVIHQKLSEILPDQLDQDQTKRPSGEHTLNKSKERSVHSTSHSDSKYRYDNFVFSFN